jgi:hypothetical protein
MQADVGSVQHIMDMLPICVDTGSTMCAHLVCLHCKQALPCACECCQGPQVTQHRMALLALPAGEVRVYGHTQGLTAHTGGSAGHRGQGEGGGEGVIFA